MALLVGDFNIRVLAPMEVVNNFLSSAVQKENGEQQESGKAMTCIRQAIGHANGQTLLFSH